MGRQIEAEVFTNTAAFTNSYTICDVGAEEHEYMSFVISHSATSNINVKIVAVNAGVSGAASLSPANMFGNTASEVAAGQAQVYRINGNYFQRVKIKLSATASVASGVVQIGWFAGNI